MLNQTSWDWENRASGLLVTTGYLRWEIHELAKLAICFCQIVIIGEEQAGCGPMDHLQSLPGRSFKWWFAVSQTFATLTGSYWIHGSTYVQSTRTKVEGRRPRRPRPRRFRWPRWPRTQRMAKQRPSGHGATFTYDSHMVHIWFTYGSHIAFLQICTTKRTKSGQQQWRMDSRYWYVVGLGVAIFNSSMLNLSIWPPSHIDRDCPRPGSSWEEHYPCYVSTSQVSVLLLKASCSICIDYNYL